jgi:hypothetical protein
VQNLRIIGREELRQLEPHIHPDATAALWSPDAGTVTPYEYTIALAESAADNGVEFRLRREVTAIDCMAESDGGGFRLTVGHWEPAIYTSAMAHTKGGGMRWAMAVVSIAVVVGSVAAARQQQQQQQQQQRGVAALALISLGPPHLLLLLLLLLAVLLGALAARRGMIVIPGGGGGGGGTSQQLPVGSGGVPVTVEQMGTGGSGSSSVVDGGCAGGEGGVPPPPPEQEVIRCAFVVNCAGLRSDAVAGLVGDRSFTIKPRLGEYLLLSKRQGHLATSTVRAWLSVSVLCACRGPARPWPT